MDNQYKDGSYEELAFVESQARYKGPRDRVEVLKEEWRRLKTSQKILIVITFTALTVVLMSRIGPEFGQIINTVKGSFLNLIRRTINPVSKALESVANATNNLNREVVLDSAVRVANQTLQNLSQTNVSETFSIVKALKPGVGAINDSTIDVLANSVARMTNQTQLPEKCLETSEGYVSNDSLKCVINGFSQMIDNLQGRFKELSDKIGELNTKVSGVKADFFNQIKDILDKFGELNTTFTNNIYEFNQRLDDTNIRVNKLIEYCVRNFNNIIGAINSLSNEATGKNLITTTSAENTTISLADSSENSVWSFADSKLDEEVFKELLKFLNSFSRDIKSTGETANNGVIIGAVSGAVSALAVIGAVFAVIKTKGGENKKFLESILNTFRELGVSQEQIPEIIRGIVEKARESQSKVPQPLTLQSVEETHELNQEGSEGVGQTILAGISSNNAASNANGQASSVQGDAQQSGTPPSETQQPVVGAFRPKIQVLDPLEFDSLSDSGQQSTEGSVTRVSNKKCGCIVM